MLHLVGKVFSFFSVTVKDYICFVQQTPILMLVAVDA